MRTPSVVSTLASRAPGRLNLVLGATILVGSHAPPPETIHLEFREGTEMEAVPSPDGRLLALQVWKHIWVVDARGGVARKLTDPISQPSEHLSPEWTPDGRSIVFTRAWVDRNNRSRRSIIRSTGGLSQDLDKKFDGLVRWSPDGTRFLTVEDGRLMSVVAAGGLPTRLNPDSIEAKDPYWSPDGRFVVFSSGGSWWAGQKLYIVSATGNSLRQLTNASDFAPSWSPDGRRIYFVSERTGVPQIWSIPAEGGAARQLTDEEDVYPYPPRWLNGVLLYTAAGQIRTIDPATERRDSISFVARLVIRREPYARRRPAIPAPGDELHVRSIYRPIAAPDDSAIVFAAMGDLWVRQFNGRIEQLTRGPAYDGDATWSPDGRRLAFVSNRDGAYDVLVMNLSDRSTRRVTSSGATAFPIWHPSGDSIVYRHSFSTLRIVGAGGGSYRTLLQPRGFGVQPLGYTATSTLVFWHSYREPLGDRASTAIRGLSATGDTITFQRSDARAKMQFAALSARGDSLAYVANGELWIGPLTGNARRIRTAAAFFPSWTSNGRIMYLTGRKVMTMDARTGASNEIPISLSYRIPVAPSLLLRNVRVLSPDPREGRWDILVQRGRIRSLRPTDNRAPAADTVIDGQGRTVIPGLFDTHDHSGWYSVDTTSVAATSVLRGVTSYGDAGSETYWLTQQIEAIQSGRITGPRIFAAGSEITGTAANVQYPQLQASTSQHVTRYLDHLDALGVSHVKAYNPWYPDVEAAVIRGAHQRGLPALSHFLRPSAVAAGLDRKEHVSLQGRAWLVRFRGDVLEVLTKMRITLGVTFPDRYATAAGAAEERRAFLDNLRLAHGAGVHLAIGTDTNVSIHDILELMVAAGISPRDALRGATRDAAATLGVDGRLGTISEGAIADLVVLEGDPLADISNARRVWATVKEGRWINAR